MITDINELRREYNERVPVLKQLGVHAKQILSREIKRKKIRIHSLHGRIKGFSSFCDKGTIIRDTFRIVKEDDKTATIGADIFGYLGVHFDVRLKEVYTGSQYNLLRDTTFENTSENDFSRCLGFNIRLSGIQRTWTYT